MVVVQVGYHQARIRVGRTEQVSVDQCCHVDRVAYSSGLRYTRIGKSWEEGGFLVAQNILMLRQ